MKYFLCDCCSEMMRRSQDFVVDICSIFVHFPPHFQRPHVHLLYDFSHCHPQTNLGPLMGAPQCRLSILRNGNVPCHYFLNFPVDLKKVQCRLSILRKDDVPCRYFSTVPVDFKEVQCRLSNLRKRRVALSILRVQGQLFL